MNAEVPKIKRGTYEIWRTDGSVESVNQKPTIGGVRNKISASDLDTVILDRDLMIVMMVDDTGMIDGRPVNAKATEIYRRIRNTPYSIHGDVIIVNDGDFA